ncbi:hypothetical protein GCM10010840_27500 [Deinococcus aerolatus]|uniref:Uncharacterized protein n=1 Tax=Deinococcus aerolatus TaxID=522487 RepID=A0ABQ2GD31_9DEIO|nr:hypothetical protein GCM10010840_27500 [Deinococcus aerolatus]
MRPEFDPQLNGAWDKIHRYHGEAAADTALRQCTADRKPVLSRGLGAWVRRIRQVLHRRPSPIHPS